MGDSAVDAGSEATRTDVLMERADDEVVRLPVPFVGAAYVCPNPL